MQILLDGDLFKAILTFRKPGAEPNDNRSEHLDTAFCKRQFIWQFKLPPALQTILQRVSNHLRFIAQADGEAIKTFASTGRKSNKRTKKRSLSPTLEE